MLMLVHGWGLNAAVFTGFTTALGLPARALDLPGHGRAPYRTGDLEPECVAERLAKDCDGPRPWLGWSLGGLVAMTLAARYPQCVSQLILVAATPCFVRRPDWAWGTEPAVLDNFSDQLAQDYEGTLRRFLTLQAGAGERTQVRQLMGDLQRGGAAQPSALAEGLSVLKAQDLRARLSLIRAPTLFLHGSHDNIVPSEAALWAAGRIAGARFCAVGRGHAPFLSDEGRCVQLVRDFLRE